MYLTVHVFDNPPEKIEITLPEEYRKLKVIKREYKGSTISADIKNGTVILTPSTSMESISLLF